MQIIPKGKFTWILLLFIAYVYYEDYRSKHNDSSLINVVESQNNTSNPIVKKESLEDKVVNTIKKNDTAKAIFEALVKKGVQDKYGTGEIREIAARETGTLAIIDILQGDGANLRCGGTAVINYEAFMSNGITFDSTFSPKGKSPLTLTTGKNQVIKGLEAGIIGMKEGGKRKISIPAELAFNKTGFSNSILAKDEVISYDVELVAIKDGPYKNGLAIDISNEIEGSGNRVLCGDKVRIRYNLTNIDGAALPNATGDATFILGTGSVPIGFELVVSDMKVSGKRTATIPYPLLKIIDKSTPLAGITFLPDTLIKADIEVIEASNH